MSIKVGINGVVRDVTQIKSGVQNTVRDIPGVMVGRSSVINFVFLKPKDMIQSANLELGGVVVNELSGNGTYDITNTWSASNSSHRDKIRQFCTLSASGSTATIQKKSGACFPYFYVNSILRSTMIRFKSGGEVALNRIADIYPGSNISCSFNVYVNISSASSSDALYAQVTGTNLYNGQYLPCNLSTTVHPRDKDGSTYVGAGTYYSTSKLAEASLSFTGFSIDGHTFPTTIYAPNYIKDVFNYK